MVECLSFCFLCSRGFLFQCLTCHCALCWQESNEVRVCSTLLSCRRDIDMECVNISIKSRMPDESVSTSTVSVRSASEPRVSPLRVCPREARVKPSYSAKRAVTQEFVVATSTVEDSESAVGVSLTPNRSIRSLVFIACLCTRSSAINSVRADVCVCIPCVFDIQDLNKCWTSGGFDED